MSATATRTMRALAKMRPGRREGVEGEIHRDLTTLARNKAVSDALVVSGEEDLAQPESLARLRHIGGIVPAAARTFADGSRDFSFSVLFPFATRSRNCRKAVQAGCRCPRLCLEPHEQFTVGCFARQWRVGVFGPLQAYKRRFGFSPYSSRIFG